MLLADILAPLEDGRTLHQGWSPKCEQFASGSDDVWGVLKTTAIQDGKFLPEHNKQLPATLEPRPLLEVHTGDLLLTCAGPRIRCGVPCLVRSSRPRLMISGKMYRMRVQEPDVTSRFIEAMLRAPESQRTIDAMKTGMSESGMNLTHERFAQLEIPLGPQAEQIRIADKLDGILARVDSCRERLNRLPLILKRFRQSVVTAAITGQLAEGRQAGMAINTKACDHWHKKRVYELCEKERVITYGVIKLGDEVPTGVPCLRTSNVRWLHIETEGMKRIASSLSSEYSRTILRGGEVLVNVRGTLGGVAVASREMVGWNVSREVAVVPVDATRIDPAFLAYSIGSTESQRWLARVEKGVAYTGINIEDLRNLPVKFPSIEEQRLIVARVHSLHAYADRLEARYTAALAQVDRLTPALLAKAYRGELVPQDPNDEPVSELMERIRAANVGKTTKPKRGKTGGQSRKPKKAETSMLSRTDIQPNHLTTILTERGTLTSEALWSASQLDINDFYDQLKAEEEAGLLKERRDETATDLRLLEAA